MPMQLFHTVSNLQKFIPLPFLIGQSVKLVILNLLLRMEDHFLSLVNLHGWILIPLLLNFQELHQAVRQT